MIWLFESTSKNRYTGLSNSWFHFLDDYGHSFQLSALPKTAECQNDSGRSKGVSARFAGGQLPFQSILQNQIVDLANEENITVDSPLDIDSQILDAGLSGSIGRDSDKDLVASNANYEPGMASGLATGTAAKPSTDSFLLDKPEPPPTLGKVDPIAEAPRKVWYFRSKSLGEKGPLKGREIQSHLDNGDIEVGCLVWREDWEDWQPAERVFPSLVAMAEHIQAKRQRQIESYEVTDVLSPHWERRRRQRRSTILGIVAIVAGLVTIGALTVVLIRLLSN